MSNSILRSPEVLRRTGLSVWMRDRLERSGKFPVRRKISARSVGWLESEISAWIESSASITKKDFSPSQATDFLPPAI